MVFDDPNARVAVTSHFTSAVCARISVRSFVSQAYGVRNVRFATLLIVLAAMAFWHGRTTGVIPLSTIGLLAFFVIVQAAVGTAMVGWLHRLIPQSPGMAFEFLLGFFACNTALFLLTLVSHFGFGWNLVLLGIGAAAVVAASRRFTRRGPSSLHDETASLISFTFVCIAATLWVGDQQPVSAFQGDVLVFSVWPDVFIHAREISAFAQSHGLASISDLRIAGDAAPIYHFASYMMPASLDALGSTSAIDAYVALQLPLGIVLMGIAAYVFVAIAFASPWAAVAASVAIVALPDAYQQGFGVRYFAFHAMSQVNLAMLYGIACMALGWTFMIEGCRRARPAGVLLAYLMLMLCLTYKAHLFVANALLMMIYPCLFFGGLKQRTRWMILAVMVVTFLAVACLAQRSARVPTLRLDGSGLATYFDMLLYVVSDGPFKTLVRWVYQGGLHGDVTRAAFATFFIFLTSFGVWVVVAPFALHKARGPIDGRLSGFVALVVFNYMAMATMLALDAQDVGAREELLNRPQAWAYFVVVTFATAAIAKRCILRWRLPRIVTGVGSAMVSVLLLLNVQHASHRLQTIPDWDGRSTYRDVNAIPTCLGAAAIHIRDHGYNDELMQDSRFDASMVATALAERQSYVSSGTFGGNAARVNERIERVQGIQETADPRTLRSWARANGVGWYLMHPEDSVRWDPTFLAQAAFRCGDYRLFRFGP